MGPGVGHAARHIEAGVSYHPAGVAMLRAVALLALSGCGGLVAHHDYDTLCRVFTEEMSRKDDDPAVRAVNVSKRLDSELLPLSTLREKVWPALANVDPKRRYELLRQPAREQGYPDWTCPPMEQYFGATPEEPVP